MRSFYIKTLGCKVNQCDSQKIRERLLTMGFREVFEDGCADINVINTCCVTSAADRKSRAAIRGVVRHKNGYVAIVGCYAGYDRFAIERMDGVDVVFDNAQRGEFSNWLSSMGEKFRMEGELSNGFEGVREGAFGGRTRAFLKVQDGCDNHCSYCVVPRVRGRSKSRPIEEILEEAKIRSGEGFKEIVLTGVCLGSFGCDFDKKVDLVDLIDKIEKIDGIKRIRLSSIEAGDVSDRLIEKIASSFKVCPHLHIPFQSGDDSILAAMNKRLKVSDYMAIIGKARKKIKNIAITCDFILGFPTETDKNFENTRKFLEFIRPLKVHFFSYSRRRGAFEFPQLPDNKSVKRRSSILKMLSVKLSDSYKRQFLGKTAEVLFEERTGGWWQGYSQHYIKVFVKHGVPLANSLARVRLLELAEGNIHAALI